jgi:hypothetical protein
MSNKFKVVYSVKQADKGNLLVERSNTFNSFIEAVKYVRVLNANSAAIQLVGKPTLEKAS